MIFFRRALAVRARQDLYIIIQNVVYRIDGRKGKIIWQQSIPGKRPSHPYADPCCILQVSHHVVYALLDFDIYALDGRTGRIIWHATNPADQTSFALVVDSQLVYIGTSDLNNSWSSPSPFALTNIRALHIADGSFAWQNTDTHPVRETGLTLENKTIYIANCVGKESDSRGVDIFRWEIYALNAANGDILWQHLMPLGASSVLSLLVEGKSVYLLAGSSLFALDKQTGEEIMITDETATSAFVIHSLEPATNKLLAEHPLSPLPSPSSIYIGSGNELLYFCTDIQDEANPFALSAYNTTGERAWHLDFPQQSPSHRASGIAKPVLAVCPRKHLIDLDFLRRGMFTRFLPRVWK